MEITTAAIRFNAKPDRFVKGNLSKDQKINAIVDTGAAVNVIDKSYVSQFAYQKIGAMEVLSGGSEPVQVDIVIIPRMTFGDLAIVNAEFITTDLRTMSMGTLDAVLGMDLFKHWLLTFDPRNNKITLSKSKLDKNDPSVLPYIQDISGLKIITNIANQEIIMNLDTGAPTAFTLPMSMIKSIPLVGELTEGPRAKLVGGDRQIKVGKLNGTIQLGKQQYVNPDLSFMSPSSPYGNIGGPILDESKLSIDQQSGLLAFYSYENKMVKKSTLKKVKRRLGIQFRGMSIASGLEISHVDAGSLAAKSGVQAGDKLITINGLETAAYDMGKLAKLFGSWEPLRIEVERNGKLHLLEISE